MRQVTERGRATSTCGDDCRRCGTGQWVERVGMAFLHCCKHEILQEAHHSPPGTGVCHSRRAFRTLYHTSISPPIARSRHRRRPSHTSSPARGPIRRRLASHPRRRNIEPSPTRRRICKGRNDKDPMKTSVHVTSVTRVYLLGIDGWDCHTVSACSKSHRRLV